MGHKSGHLYNNVSFFNPHYLAYLLFSAEGRINRKKYIAGVVYLILVMTALIFLSTFVFYSGTPELAGNATLVTLVTVIDAFAFYCGLVLAIKRLHDLNWSGWMILVLFFINMACITVYQIGFVLVASLFYALINVAFIVYLWFFKGTPGDNKYGPPAI